MLESSRKICLNSVKTKQKNEMQGKENNDVCKKRN